MKDFFIMDFEMGSGGSGSSETPAHTIKKNKGRDYKKDNIVGTTTTFEMNMKYPLWIYRNVNYTTEKQGSEHFFKDTRNPGFVVSTDLINTGKFTVSLDMFADLSQRGLEFTVRNHSTNINDIYGFGFENVFEPYLKHGTSFMATDIREVGNYNQIFIDRLIPIGVGCIILYNITLPIRILPKYVPASFIILPPNKQS